MPVVAVDPRDIILRLLQMGPLGPTELMVFVQRETHLDDLSIKDAVSDLLDQEIVEFSPDRKLRLRSLERKVS